MSTGAHIAELERKHQKLSDQVDSIQNAPSADILEIKALKKQKLWLKEEISRLRSC